MNKYHIYEEEAKGKYSVIFKARRKKKLEFVAIKRMDKARKQKILNEAKILNELHHNNIIKFFEFMETKNHMWAVTQYCPGGDLLKLIEQDKSLPENVVRNFAIQIMKGLSFAHSKGIVICDLKPATILINQYGSVKIGDLGSAQYLVDLIRSQNEKKKGTPCYMAPELFQVGSVYSFASDFWALGCILYEFAQGNPPFVSTSLHDISNLAKTATTPKVQFFSSDFNNFLEKLLAKEPENRIIWKQIFNHPWIKGDIPFLQMPKQPHFQEYKKSLKKSLNIEKLRVSQKFDDYGSLKPIPANDRRQQFVFESDQYGEEQFEPQEKMNFEENEKEPIINMKKQKEIFISKRPSQIPQIQDSTTINIFMQTLSSKNLPSLDEAINHQSDNSVKPIIGNKEIEPIESSSFNKKSLGFQYIEPELIADGILNGQMEYQLKRIFDGMVGDQKYNVLGYFQSIIQNSDIANHLFKGSFIPYYMKLLKGYKQASLKSKICQILGLLIRHATSIDPQILKYGIINGFLEAIKDKNEKVRRKSMAALGELLFYGATQVDEKINQWDLSINLIHNLLKILKNNSEDEIVRVYCCKSVENITAQAKEVGLKFAQLDTLLVLTNNFISSKNECFKTSISSTLHHIMQLNMTLRQVFLDKVGINNVIYTFRNPESSNKTIQILLWVFLTQFDKSPKSKLSKSFLQDQQLLDAVLSLLDINSSVIKGRVFLFSYFVINSNPKKVISLLQSKTFHIIERQGRDGAKYQTNCLQFILVFLYENYGKFVKFIEEQVKKCLKNVTSLQVGKKNYFIGVINHMTNSQIFEELFESFSNIEELMNLLNIFDTKSDNSQFIIIKSQYMQVIQKFFSNSTVAEKLQEPYSTKIMPFLVGKILKSNQNDIKFCCMKYLLYLVSIYMSEQNLYDSTILSSTTSKIVSMICDHLIPQLDFLLGQQEAVISMTLKLIAVLFQTNIIFVRKFYEYCKVASLLPFYNEHSNVNILKVVQMLVCSKIMSQQDLRLFLPTGLKLLIYYFNSGQQIFLEYPLEILKGLIQECKQEQIDKIWQISISLQAHEDSVIRQKAQNLIEAFLKNKKISGKGKWQVKDKKGLQNYEQYIKISGKQYDGSIADTLKKATNRYR